MTAKHDRRAQFSKLINEMYDAGKYKSRQEFGDLIGVTDDAVANWLKGGYTDRVDVWIKIAELKGWTLDRLKDHIYGETEAIDPQGEFQVLSYIATAQTSGLARCLQSAVDRLRVIAEQQSVVEPLPIQPQLQPINAIAAEFSRSINAALVEHEWTIEQASQQLQIERDCLAIVAAGQKVPGDLVAEQLLGFIKDKHGNLYTDDVVMEMISQSDLPTRTKKPPQRKRHQASNGAV